MDYGKMTLDEIKKGYRYDKEKDAYLCNYCGQVFAIGQVSQIDGDFFMAESAIIKHIRTAHNGNLVQLLSSESKYNTLTPNQKDLLSMFYAKKSDKEISKKLNIGANIVHTPQVFLEYGPNYYAMFFKDLDGIKYEIVCNKPNSEVI